jgi:PAS domain S-box-containing protein
MVSSSTILIVDDEPANYKTLEGLLRSPNYRILYAESGPVALEKAAAERPDVILLDVMMPGMDGFEVCRRLRADTLLAEVPIIMVTALSDRESRLHGMEAGADDFVTKPIDRIELRARVRTITRLNRYRRLLDERTHRQQAEDETRRRSRELTLLNRVIATSASTLDPGEALHTACQALAFAFELPFAAAVLLNEARTHGTIVAEYPFQLVPGAAREPGWLGQLGNLFSAADVPTLDHALAHKAPLVAGDAQHDPRLAALRPRLRASGIHTLIGVPILARDLVVGTFILSAGQARTLTEQDIALAQSIATAAGQALEAADLYQQLRRHATDLAATVAERTRELQIARDRTRAILEALGEAVVVASPAGMIQYMNPAASVLTGYTAEEALGQSWRLWHSERQPARMYPMIQESIAAGQIWRGEATNRRKDGALYPVALTAAPLFDPQDQTQLVGFVIVQRDITPLKEAERLKDQFVSNVSHELRTPLSVITLLSGNLDTLYDRLADTQRRAMIHDIREQTRVLNELITGVLAISRIDSAAQPAEHRPADLVRLAREELEKQLPLAQKKEQSVQMSGLEALIVSGDDGQLRQVVRNLINNAIKYTNPGGRIDCTCAIIACPSEPAGPPPGAQEQAQAWPGSAELPSGRWAALRVCDTGSGIDADDLPRIFERFYRVKAQGNIPGTGLGLSIARELVELHQGQLVVASAVGIGSNFAVYLPLAEDTEQ